MGILLGLVFMFYMALIPLNVVNLCALHSITCI